MNDPEIKYIWFDFHGECKNMKWENLSKLVSAVDSELQKWNHFTATVKYGFDYRKEFNDK